MFVPLSISLFIYQNFMEIIQRDYTINKKNITQKKHMLTYTEHTYNKYIYIFTHIQMIDCLVV